MEIRYATVADGVRPEVAARRTAFVLGEPPVVVRIRYASPVRVVAVAARPLTEAETAELVDEIGWWAPQVAVVEVDGRPIERENVQDLSTIRLADLTVGQLTVSAPKVEAARAWVGEPGAVVITGCEIEGETMIVDGHSRAVAALQEGVEEVGLVLDEPGDLQRAARSWCRAAGIRTVADLARHVVGAEEHQRVWVDRCQAYLAEHDGESRSD